MSNRSQQRADETCSDPRWAAVVARDQNADGLFFYSVKTTGVYCRPSCGARTPKPENVAFHPTCTEAERSGFRPCKRCRPNQPPLAERQTNLVADLCRRIDAGEIAPTLDALARQAQMSPLSPPPHLQGRHRRDPQGLRCRRPGRETA